MNMEVDAEKLIVLVEQRPAIFNYTMKDHHNKDLIEKLWEDVASEIGGVPSKLTCLFYEHKYHT